MLLIDFDYFHKTPQPLKMRRATAFCLVLMLAILLGSGTLPAQNDELPSEKCVAIEKDGLGWGTRKKYGLKLVGHDGSQQGTSTSITLAPEKRAGIVVLANMDDVEAVELSEQILKIALDLKDETK